MRVRSDLKGRCSTTELRPYLLSLVYRETVWRASRLAHISLRIDRIVYGGFGSSSQCTSEQFAR